MDSCADSNSYLFDQKLEELEREEEMRVSAGVYASDSEEEDEETQKIARLASKIREKKKIMKIESRLDKRKGNEKPRASRKRKRSVSRLREEMENLRIDVSNTQNDETKKPEKPKARKRKKLLDFARQSDSCQEKRVLRPRNRIPSTKSGEEGDGNDSTPSPRKLASIEKELEKLKRQISEMIPLSKLPAADRRDARKEKNKLVASVYRLKKKAQDEANKLKLYGLQKEQRKLTAVIAQVKQLLKTSVSRSCSDVEWAEITARIDSLLEDALRTTRVEA